MEETTALVESTEEANGKPYIGVQQTIGGLLIEISENEDKHASVRITRQQAVDLKKLIDRVLNPPNWKTRLGEEIFWRIGTRGRSF
jgi:Holliday junction resolvase